MPRDGLQVAVHPLQTLPDHPLQRPDSQDVTQRGPLQVSQVRLRRQTEVHPFFSIWSIDDAARVL